MQRDQAYQAVCDTFGEYFEVHPGQVLTHHELLSDWGVSGAELELLTHNIEQRVGVELSDYSRRLQLRACHSLTHASKTGARRAAHVEAQMRKHILRGVTPCES